MDQRPKTGRKDSRKMEFSGWKRAVGIYFLVTLLLFLGSANGNRCSPHVSGFCGERVFLPCDFDSNFEGVYWFEESDDDEPLIRLESGYKAGRGYKSHEYDVLQNGSLVIKNTQFTNNQQYTVILLDSEFRDDEFTVDFSVTENCPSRVTGRLHTEGVISCCFNPENEGVYWFEEHDDIEPLIRSESGMKFGRGYDSHEYDMLPTGSLVIKNVQHTHEQMYKVILLDTEFQEKTIFVDFSVTETLCTKLPPPNHGTINHTAMLAEYNCDEGFHLNNNALVECILDDATDTYHWSGSIPKCVKDIVTTTTVATTTVATTTVATTPKTTTTKMKIYSPTTGSTTTNTPRPTLNDKNVHRNTLGSKTDKVHPTTKRGGSNGSHLRVHLAVITLAAITPFL
ncbi:uncharacterized protein [Apostichopus japonicus]|uniref:uncharacterized protein n=1 Tax=Stichopus japonicus TaxID=307972 RepID=UPI003AB30AA0